MITLSVAFILLGFCGFYIGSKRVPSQFVDGVRAIIRSRMLWVRPVALVLWLVAAILCVERFGVGSGLLFFVVALMTGGAAIIILQPLQVLKKGVLLVLFLSFLLIEIFV